MLCAVVEIELLGQGVQMCCHVLLVVRRNTIVGRHRRFAAHGFNAKVQLFLDRFDIVTFDQAAMRGFVEQFTGRSQVFTYLVDLADQDMP